MHLSALLQFKLESHGSFSPIHPIKFGSLWNSFTVPVQLSYFIKIRVHTGNPCVILNRPDTLFGDTFYKMDTYLAYEDINLEGHNSEFLVRLRK